MFFLDRKESYFANSCLATGLPIPKLIPSLWKQTSHFFTVAISSEESVEITPSTNCVFYTFMQIFCFVFCCCCCCCSYFNFSFIFVHTTFFLLASKFSMKILSKCILFPSLKITYNFLSILNIFSKNSSSIVSETTF